jgi:hypothetical protein
MSFAGGTVGSDTILVSDTPTLEVGKRYIIFGYADNRYSVPVVGHEQGVFRVVYDSVTKQDIVVDYNWYQLERTESGRIIRGIITEVDSKDALVERPIVEKKKQKGEQKITVTDVYGREVPQNTAGFEKPRLRDRGERVTKSVFADFIREQTQRLQEKKERWR